MHIKITFCQIKSIKTAAERALSFVSTFGLTLEKVVLKSSSNNEIEINYHSPSSSRSTSVSQSESIDETLYLLEKFGVSDEFYHEQAMLHPQFPRSYKVKNARRDISGVIDLTPLPPPFSGAYRPLKEFISLLLSVVSYIIMWVLII